MLKGFSAPIDKSKVSSWKSAGGTGHGMVPSANRGKTNISFKSGTKGVKMNGK